MRKTTLLLASDHPLVREGIRSILKTRDELEVVAEASTGEEARRLCIEMRPDLAVIEMSGPDLDALEVIRSTREQQEQTRFLVLFIHDSMYNMLEAVRAGASGCLPKRASSGTVLDAIDATRAGKMYLEPSMGAQASATLAHRRGALPSWSTLSKRELEVLKLTAEGYSSKVIGGRIGVSPKTVNTHRSNLMKKLEIRKVASLVRYAIREGIITP